MSNALCRLSYVQRWSVRGEVFDVVGAATDKDQAAERLRTYLARWR